MVTTRTTTVETAGWSIERLTGEQRAAQVAHYRRTLATDRYFGETPEKVLWRKADAAWWLERFAEAEYWPMGPL